MFQTFVGWVATDPELRQTSVGPVTQFRVGERGKPGEPSTWVTAQAFDDLAERIVATLRKGTPVIGYGVRKGHEWTDDAGTKRHKTFVQLRHIGPDLRACAVEGVTPVRETRREEDQQQPAGEAAAEQADASQAAPETLPADPFDED